MDPKVARILVRLIAGLRAVSHGADGEWGMRMADEAEAELRASCHESRTDQDHIRIMPHWELDMRVRLISEEIVRRLQGSGDALAILEDVGRLEAQRGWYEDEIARRADLAPEAP